MTHDEQRAQLREKLIEKLKRISDYPDTYSAAAEEILTLLDSYGVVMKDENQETKLHDMNSALFAEGYAAAVGDLKQSGFIRTFRVKE